MLPHYICEVKSSNSSQKFKLIIFVKYESFFHMADEIL